MTDPTQATSKEKSPLDWTVDEGRDYAAHLKASKVHGYTIVQDLTDEVERLRRRLDGIAAYSTGEPAHDPAVCDANERLATIMVGAAGKHAERVVELEAEVSTLRDHLAEQNRLLSLNVSEVERLRSTPPPPVAPSAWYRGVRSGAPGEPDEYDVEMSYGDDQPEGKGWLPLYRTPMLVRLHDDVLRRLDEWFAAYMHDRQNHDEAAALLSQVRDLRSTSTKGSDHVG